MALRGIDQGAAWIMSIVVSSSLFSGIYFGLKYVAKKSGQAHVTSSDVVPDHGDSKPNHDALPAHSPEVAADAKHESEKHEPAADEHAKPSEDHAEKPAGSHAVGRHWSYSGENGPEKWAEMDEKSKVCSTGKRQSPIDIEASKPDKDLKPLQFKYSASLATLQNNGHTIQVDFPPGNWLAMNGERYDLLQFHFHVPSEHRIQGSQNAMEVHLVHKNAHDELAVVGVMFMEGGESNVLKPLWSQMPKGKKKLEKPLRFDPAQLLPKARGYTTYAGSLTTPPCSEGVTWVVMTSPVSASAAQVDKFVDVVGFNARPVQATFGREVTRTAK